MGYEAFDVVVVPFPFTDSTTTKRRPALILSDANRFNIPVGHSIMAMITTAKQSVWPLDAPIQDLDSAGSPAPSIVRMKLFTLDHRFIVRTLGALATMDKEMVEDSIARLFPFIK